MKLKDDTLNKLHIHVHTETFFFQTFMGILIIYISSGFKNLGFF